MRKMKTNIQYLLLSMLMICGMLASCTEETPLNSTSGNSGSGKVILSYSVSNSVQSRADTDAGWSDFDFNENKVTRLDLYIFRNNGELFRHIPNTSIEYDDADETYNNVTKTTADDWEIEGLDPEDINGNEQIYLIANCDAAANIETLSGLQDEVLNGLVCNAKQDKFVMVGAGDDVTIASEGNDIIISVNLIRVAAKICLSFASNTSWTDVSYRFIHHATTSALLKESETDHLATQILSTSPSEDGLTEITNQTENLYNDEGTQKLVLYSYANNWYKEGKNDSNPDVNGSTDMSDQIYKQEPIDETKQTYILLRAPYNGNYYYYKVPVNYRLPINNDEVFDTEEEWEAFKESYRHLYQLQRNYIYDITVTIDREGGTETKPVTPRLYYQVIPFDEETIDIPAFE